MNNFYEQFLLDSFFLSVWTILDEIVHLILYYIYYIELEVDFVSEKNRYVKHFPSDPTIYKGKMTFLTDKKIDAELYAILMQYSYGSEDNETKDIETRVYKKDLPSQEVMCKKLGIKSRTTYRTHLNYLIEQGYIIDMGKYYLIDTYKENIFLQINTDTIAFLNDTVAEAVWKAYLYLGQRWAWKKSSFVFTLEDLALHIGEKINNNSSMYSRLNNILQCLENNGLIKVVTFYDGKIPQKRLIDFSFHHKNS